ncbi:MAG TPA: hypothetical protein VNP72_01050 [Longimicrobium sp.]|nr:hypothetical protein [Longimicrobium sp.]
MPSEILTQIAITVGTDFVRGAAKVGGRFVKELLAYRPVQVTVGELPAGVVEPPVRQIAPPPRNPGAIAAQVADAFLKAVQDTDDTVACRLCEPGWFKDVQRKAALLYILQRSRVRHWKTVGYHYPKLYRPGSMLDFLGVEYETRPRTGSSRPRARLLVWVVPYRNDWRIHSTDWHADGLPDI